MRAVLIFSSCLILGCDVPPGSTSPAPVVCSVSPTSVDFGETDATLDGASVRTRIRLRNHSGTDRNLVLLPLGKPFSVLPVPGSLRLPAASTRDLTVFFTPTDGMLHSGELKLIDEGSTDGRCELSVPLRGLGAGVLSLGGTPTPLDFGFMEPGAQQRLRFDVTNSTRAAVRLDSVNVVFDSGFSLPAPVTVIEPTSLLVPASGTSSFELVAAPQLLGPVSGRVVITAGPTTLQAPFALRVGQPEPELFPASLGPWLVGFHPDVEPHGFSQRPIRLRNVGSSGPSEEAGLRLLSVTITALVGESRELKLHVPPEAFLGLPSGASAELSVRLDPSTPGPKEFVVMLFTNSPSAPRITLPVSAHTEVLPPCELSVTPQLELRLAPIDEGRSAGSVTFTNTGANRCILDDVRLTGGAENQFTIASGQAPQLELQPGQAYTAIIVGPRAAAVTHVGALAFHVFNANSRVELIELYSTP